MRRELLPRHLGAQSRKVGREKLLLLSHPRRTRIPGPQLTDLLQIGEGLLPIKLCRRLLAARRMHNRQAGGNQRQKK